MRSRKRRYDAPVLRRLFIFASALSLLLCLTAGTMWVRSYWKGEFVVGLRAILPAVQFPLLLRSGSRRRAGLSSVCGYDLRASKGRCPECGTVPKEGINTGEDIKGAGSL